jgi:hypothetical protein
MMIFHYIELLFRHIFSMIYAMPLSPPSAAATFSLRRHAFITLLSLPRHAMTSPPLLPAPERPYYAL